MALGGLGQREGPQDTATPRTPPTAAMRAAAPHIDDRPEPLRKNLEEIIESVVGVHGLEPWTR